MARLDGSSPGPPNRGPGTWWDGDLPRQPHNGVGRVGSRRAARWRFNVVYQAEMTRQQAHVHQKRTTEVAARDRTLEGTENSVTGYLIGRGEDDKKPKKRQAEVGELKAGAEGGSGFQGLGGYRGLGSGFNVIPQQPSSNRSSGALSSRKKKGKVRAGQEIPSFGSGRWPKTRRRYQRPPEPRPRSRSSRSDDVLYLETPRRSDPVIRRPHRAARRHAGQSRPQVEEGEEVRLPPKTCGGRGRRR